MQPVKLAVNSGLLDFVVLHGDLLQNKLFIQHPLMVQIVLDLFVILGLLRKLNIQLPSVSEVGHLQNDLCLLGEDFV